MGVAEYLEMPFEREGTLEACECLLEGMGKPPGTASSCKHRGLLKAWEGLLARPPAPWGTLLEASEACEGPLEDLQRLLEPPGEGLLGAYWKACVPQRFAFCFQETERNIVLS